MKWNKIDTGIYRGPLNYRVFQRVAAGPGGLLSKRFPLTTPLKTLKVWQAEQRVTAHRERPAKGRPGSFAEDVDTYLRQIAAMPSIASRRYDLSTWMAVFGDMSRAQITTGMVRAQLQAWRTVGPIMRYSRRTGELRVIPQPLSASACNHRRTALLHLFNVLDGKSAKNPVRGIPKFQEPHPEPRGQDLAFLEAARQRMQNPQDRARVGVLMWTGARGTCELGRMTPQHLDLQARYCHIPTAKGGRLRIVTLNAHGLAAWQEFIRVEAWGPYSAHRLCQAFRRACQREANARGIVIPRIKAYDLRHSIATAILQVGADLADVQDMLGHATAQMTRRYAPFQRAKLAAATDRLESILAAPVPAPATQPAPAPVNPATAGRRAQTASQAVKSYRRKLPQTNKRQRVNGL